MEPRLSLLTIGVDDLAAVRAFYERAFGWTPEAANADIVFFKLNGFLLAFFRRDNLAADASPDASPEPAAAAAKPFTLAYNVATEAEVDDLVAAPEARGAAVVRRPDRTFFGAYRGYVADPEGNLWEIATNPFVTLDDQGNAVAHADISGLGG